MHNWVIVNRISDFLNIHRGERWLVLLLLIHSFFVGLTLTFTDTAAYTLFLGRFDASQLPIVYITASIVTVVVGVVYSVLERYVSFRLLLTINMLVVIGALVSFAILFISTDNPFPAFIAVVGFDVIWVLTSLEFWGLAGRVFTVRQGKRLFGLIGSGEMVATITGGAMVPFLVLLMDTVNLFYLAALSMGFSIILMRNILRRFSQVDEDTLAVTQSTVTIDRSTRELLKDRYIRSIFLLAGLAVITIYFVDNAFYAQADLQYNDDETLASFLGLFLAIAGVAQLVTRAVFSGRLISRYGVVAGLLILPMMLALGSALSVFANQILGNLSWVFFFVVLTKFFDKTFRYSINRASGLVLYQPLSQRERLWAQTTSESIIEPFAGIIAGAILLILNSIFAFGSVEILLAMLFIVGLWLVVIIRVNRTYILSLINAMTTSQLHGAELQVNDQETINVLLQRLRSPYPNEVIFALNAIEELNHPKFEQSVLDLLQHASIDVQKQALAKVERHKILQAKPIMNVLMGLPSAEGIHGDIVRTFASLEDSIVARPYLESADKSVQLGAIVGLMKHTHDDATETAHQKIMQLANSPMVNDRVVAAQAIGEVGQANLHRPLIPLLQDENSLVRRAAIVSAGQVKQRALWSYVLANLHSSDDAMLTVQTLIQAGEEILPQLVSRFEDEGQTRRVRQHIIQIISQLSGDAPLHWLEERIDYPDNFLRYHILQRLQARGFQSADELRSKIEGQIESEVEYASWLVSSAIDIKPFDSNNLLLRAFERELFLVQQRVLLLLSFFYDANSMSTIIANFIHPTKQRRAYAMEVLESMIEVHLRPIVLPLLEDVSLQQRRSLLRTFAPQSSQTFAERLKEILTDYKDKLHPWTKACSVYIATLHNDDALAVVISPAMDDTDPIVEQTALWAIYRLTPSLYRMRANLLKSDDETLLKSDLTLSTLESIDEEIRGAGKMLLMIEKVLILKTVSIFSEMQDDLLAEIAMIMEEVSLHAGTEFITKGEEGDALYLIADGQVRVHDGDRTIVTLGEREVVGELALLDSEPRNASVTAEVDTILLKLNQEPFYELLANRPEVVRGVLRVLTRKLRASS